MMRKWAICLVLILLAACRGQDPYRQPILSDIPSSYVTGSSAGAAAKIAVLVPLSGKSADTGEDMKKAAMLAGFDRAKSGAAVVFFDTGGTAEGAAAAYEQARTEQPDVIVGPVFSAETKRVRDESPNVPVLSFTSDTGAVGNGVYTMALLIPAQVERIVEFACNRGQRRLAVIGPENAVGKITMNTLAEAVKTCPGMELAGVSLYAPKTVNFEPAVSKLIPRPIDPRKKNLTDAERAIMETPIADRVNFDSLLVFEDGVKLQQVMSMLAYYDVTPTALPVYGLSSWAGMRDNALIGGYYPAMPSGYSADFEQRFAQNFGHRPVKLASFAYDGVAIGALLGNAGQLNNAALTDARGFNGVNGRFRLNEDGTNTRLLNMMQIKSKNQAVVAEPAPAEMPMKMNGFY